MVRPQTRAQGRVPLCPETRRRLTYVAIKCAIHSIPLVTEELKLPVYRRRKCSEKYTEKKFTVVEEAEK